MPIKMRKNIFGFTFCLLFSTISFAQTKVSGIVIDKKNQPIPFASIAFKNSTVGVLANEDGTFYLESPKTYNQLVVSFDGYSDREITLTKTTTYEMKIVLKETENLKDVVIFRGKTSKKNNPALDILRKIWERRRKNGLNMFNQYQYSKYEKVEFDMNTIDSAFMKKKLFKGMDFIFKNIDTSKITGKSYLPIFINEALYEVYGDNISKNYKEELKANKNSGLDNNDGVNTFIKDLYSQYDIYNNYITFFDKSFTSPLSRTGIDVYNYVLSDTAVIDNRKCYNIHFYPRRKSELTFKGDFWVNDTTWAIKKINMAVTKSANINWVKDIYIEQEFEVMNDSVFLLTRDYLMTDFALSKDEKSKGVYGKRTTLAKNHVFNQPIADTVFRQKVNYFDEEAFKKTDAYWTENRFEKLNKDELSVYKMLDTLKTVKKFRDMYNLVTILTTGYIKKPNIDYGPVLSTIGYNAVEGLRLRVGARTFFNKNDIWRLQGYGAYGFKDHQFKYGISGKWMIAKDNRWILSGGTRSDVEQIGASLTTTNDVLGRSFATSGILTTGVNGKLTNINLTNIALEVEPIKHLTFSSGFSYRTLQSASQSFSLEYYADDTFTKTKSSVKQSEAYLQMEWTPNRVTTGYGVERKETTNPYSRIFLNYAQGIKGILNSDFNYQKIQFYYKQPIRIGPLGNSTITTEMGKTFGKVPLGLMNVVPGNQSILIIQNTFNNLNFYEFVTDQYATLQWEHNFGGRLFARVPYIRKLNWREFIGVKSVIGSVTEENRALNAADALVNGTLQHFEYIAPSKPYWEYSAGIGNIFKVLRLDFSWRGNYKNLSDANTFTIKGAFGISF